MRVIYWNMEKKQTSWNAVAWMLMQSAIVNESPQNWLINNFQNNLTTIPFLADILIMAEPGRPLPSLVYNSDWVQPGRIRQPLIWRGGALETDDPTPDPDLNPMCVRKFWLPGLLPDESEWLYVLWNNERYDVRNNAVVNAYMQSLPLIQQVRPPVAIDIYPRAGPALVFRMAALHLSSTQVGPRNASLLTWIEQVVTQSNAPNLNSALFRVGCMMGDFNLDGTSFGMNGEFQQRTLPIPLPANAPGGTTLSLGNNGAVNFVNPFDKVVTSAALGGVATPQANRAGRVYGPPPPNSLAPPAAYADLAQVPPYFFTQASNHVPIYVEYLGF
jgi:hypothetical protein